MRGHPFLQVRYESLRGAADIVIVHRVRPDARELRPVERLRFTAFGGGDDLADGPPAQAPRAEGQRAKEAVVEFRPLATRDEFGDAIVIKFAGGAARREHGGDVLRALGKELAFTRGGFDRIVQRGHGGGKCAIEVSVRPHGNAASHRTFLARPPSPPSVAFRRGRTDRCLAPAGRRGRRRGVRWVVHRRFRGPMDGTNHARRAASARLAARRHRSHAHVDLLEATRFARPAPAAALGRRVGQRAIHRAGKRVGVPYRLPARAIRRAFFLDQRDNRRALRARVRPGVKVLNCFAYTCAFSVAAAAAGARTVSVDLSRRSLDWGKENFRLNGLDPAADAGHDFLAGDVFEWLRRLARQGRRFGGVVLDPPTFSRDRKGRVFRVEDDFGALVALAAALLVPGGWMLCSTNARTLTAAGFRRAVMDGLPVGMGRMADRRRADAAGFHRRTLPACRVGVELGPPRSGSFQAVPESREGTCLRGLGHLQHGGRRFDSTARPQESGTARRAAPTL